MRTIVRSTGVKVQGNPAKIHATLPEFSGRHLWIFAGVWRVENALKREAN